MHSISIPSGLSILLALQCLLYLSLAQTTTGQLGDAAQNLNNPPGAAYVAELTEGPIRGRVIAINAQEKGTAFSVRFENLPTEGGPFPYHIHVMPVPESNNCTETLAHLDPYIRGEDTPCQQDQPQTCQVGDLGGKHGKIEPKGPENSFEASYTDSFVSLTPGQGAFFGNRSFVIHYANKTRITCANFISADKAFADLPAGEMPSNWPSGWPSPWAPKPTGGPGDSKPGYGSDDGPWGRGTGRGDVPGGGPGRPSFNGKNSTGTSPQAPQVTDEVPGATSALSELPAAASSVTTGSAKQQGQTAEAASRGISFSLAAIAAFVFAAVAL